MPLTFKPATRDDLGFLQSLLPRFVSFTLPPGFEEGAVMAGAAQNLMAALAEESPDTALLVAWLEEEGQVARRCGFVRVETERPLFGKPYAYLADLALEEWAQGRGLARELLAQAEAWAAGQGLGRIKLHVFATNERARKLYEAAGYEVEVLSMGKRVQKR